ncbi:MAG: glycosyltransferase family 2 protein [Chitinophagales bacterium]|nr:glycosyltransferase family 2 protein [Chitinophagaceae bacterium]MCB9065042.1 glycosyltransferase family 2 protein [Chitinophagales bacterium]
MQNLCNSVTKFYPEFDVAIFDDDSNDELTKKVLNELQNAGAKVMVASAKNDSKHGGLYTQMNNALQYAIEEGYDYAYFVQDDMQFLWRDELLESRVKSAFERKECLMCNCSFLQKILTEGIEDRLPKVDGTHVYSFETNGVADTGVIDIKKAESVGLNFPEKSERGNGRYWYDKGYRLYWLPVSHLAWLPWPSTYRNKQLEQRRVNVLEPLSQSAINRIKDNTGYAYLEDYTSLVKWKPKPYWFTASPGKLNLLKIYMKYYFRALIGKN